MLVKSIRSVPDEIFLPALAEIESIKWDTIADAARHSTVFDTSTAIHIRAHKVGNRPRPTTVNEWSVITECVDKPYNAAAYPMVYATANWMSTQVNGIALGRVMIVKLVPQGIVALHVDPLDYFAMYSRFHVPFRTNPGVIFSGGPGTVDEHMPQQHISQLNNRLPHMLANNSNDYRIHLIVDIALDGGNQIF